MGLTLKDGTSARQRQDWTKTEGGGLADCERIRNPWSSPRPMKQYLKMHGVHQPQITHDKHLKKHIRCPHLTSWATKFSTKNHLFKISKKNSLAIVSNQPRISRPHDSPHLQRPNDYLVKCLRVAVPNEDLQPRCPRPRGSYTVLPHTILAVEDPWPRVRGDGLKGPMGNPYINPI